MHQLGNHGPAYSKRYPKTFEKYTPVCEDEQLQKCSRQSIINAYDNSVLYTDHFLAGVIDWLKGMKGMDTGLLYVSDHGENLGENNLYLHGAPEFMAPSVQKGSSNDPLAFEQLGRESLNSIQPALERS